MKTSESIKNVAKALVLIQSELTNPFKGKKGYGYNYSPIDEILKENRPIHAKHSCCVIQSDYKDELGNNVCETTIMHESGEWISNLVTTEDDKLKGMNAYQTAGSRITYLRRYGYCALMGISADEDQDAHGEVDNTQQNKITKKQVEEIKMLIGQAMETPEGLDYDKFKSFMMCENVEDMLASNYTKVKATLEKKISKGK